MQHVEKAHWDAVYAGRPETELSWYQRDPALSLRLIQELAPNRDSRIIDAGAGASRLVDGLIGLGYHHLTVVDLSEAALMEMRSRLGENGATVKFVVGDILEAGRLGRFDLWHDRAVFHFLTAPEQRARYVEVVHRSLSPGGHLVLAAFALDGPQSCSGLPVCRYDAVGLAEVLGTRFALLRSHREIHQTPGGAVQPFTYGVFRRD